MQKMRLFQAKKAQEFNFMTKKCLVCVHVCALQIFLYYVFSLFVSRGENKEHIQFFLYSTIHRGAKRFTQCVCLFHINRLAYICFFCKRNILSIAYLFYFPRLLCITFACLVGCWPLVCCYKSKTTTFCVFCFAMAPHNMLFLYSYQSECSRLGVFLSLSQSLGEDFSSTNTAVSICVLPFVLTVS